MQEDFAHAQRPTLRMQIPDGVLTGRQRLANVIDFVEIGNAALDRHGDGEGLEHRSQLIAARAQPVGARDVEPIGGTRWINSGQGNSGQDFSRGNVEHQACGCRRRITLYGALQFLANDMLHAHVQRQAHGRLG